MMSNRRDEDVQTSTSTSTNTSIQLMEKLGYKVGAKIGFGSYSTVRMGYSKKYEKPVALKIIWKDRASELFQKRFLPRELLIAKALRHPNIVQYLQCIETSRRFIIVMEYTPHGSLLDLMTLKNVLTECEASNYFRQLISALDFCHSKFIAHRDLKLENLLIFWENRLKVGDFGFSRYFNTIDPSTTFSRTFCGSDAYISSEILHQNPYNPLLADIWACGVILFAMVFGRLPFDDFDSIQKLIEVCFSSIRCYHYDNSYKAATIKSIERYFQAVDKGLVFPDDTIISDECRDLIKKLMSPESHRPSTSSISQESWMLAHLKNNDSEQTQQ